MSPKSTDMQIIPLPTFQDGKGIGNCSSEVFLEKLLWALLSPFFIHLLLNIYEFSTSNISFLWVVLFCLKTIQTMRNRKDEKAAHLR